jgi:hypothetical protein
MILLVHLRNIKKHGNPRKNCCVKFVSSFVNKVLTFHDGK